MSDYELTVACECGTEHTVGADTGRVACNCGARYAVTLTQLESPCAGSGGRDAA